MSTATTSKKSSVGVVIGIICIVLVLAVLAAGVAGYYFVIMVPQRAVKAAESFIEQGSYIDAYQVLQNAKIPSVFGSEKLTEKKTGILAMKEQLVAEHPTVVLHNVKVGDVITYGHYEQDGDAENGKEPLEWIVLDIDDETGRVLVLSRYCISCQRFNESGGGVTWKESSIRAWLNKKEGKYAFYGNAFTETERSFIFNKHVHTDRNPQYYTSGGSDVDDHLFLLSVQEVEEYLTSDEVRRCEPTLASRREGSYCPREGEFTAYCRWWLRTPGETNKKTVYVRYDGTIDYQGGAPEGSAGDTKFGSYSGADRGSARPAMWIRVEYLTDNN